MRKNPALILLHHYFDDVFESCKLGLRKPEPAIYKHVCSRMNVEPSEVCSMCMHVPSSRLMCYVTTAYQVFTVALKVKQSKHIESSDSRVYTGSGNEDGTQNNVDNTK